MKMYIIYKNTYKWFNDANRNFNPYKAFCYDKRVYTFCYEILLLLKSHALISQHIHFRFQCNSSRRQDKNKKKLKGVIKNH